MTVNNYGGNNMTLSLAGKTFVVMGVANKRSK